MSYMNLYEPWGLLNQVLKNKGQSFHNVEEERSASMYNWIPAADIREEPHQFVIEVDIPGVEPGEIEISMKAGILTVQGERKQEKQVDGENYQRVERFYGTFHRQFSLPDTADSEQISAVGKQGVLQINIPKKAVAQPRRIKVNVY